MPHHYSFMRMRCFAWHISCLHDIPALLLHEFLWCLFLVPQSWLLTFDFKSPANSEILYDIIIYKLFGSRNRMKMHESCDLPNWHLDLYFAAVRMDHLAKRVENVCPLPCSAGRRPMSSQQARGTTTILYIRLFGSPLATQNTSKIIKTSH